MSPMRKPTAAPSWPTLLALIAGVLVVHLALLVDELPGFPLAAQPVAPVLLPAATTQAGSDVPNASNATPRAPVARVSTVRWIVPAAPAAQATTQPAPARASPSPSPRPPPRPLAPAPVVEPVVARADPAVQAAPAPALIAEAETAEPAPSERFALAESDTTERPETSEPAANRMPSEDVEATTAEPDNEVLAAAAVRKRTQGAATSTLPPSQPPASTRLDYAVTGRVKGLAYNAEGQLDWTLADGRYSARMEMKVFLLGSRVQTSTGRVGPGGLSPERFADKSRSEKAAHFDAGLGRVRFSNNAPDAALQPGAQDRLSLFLQIAGLLQARPQAYVTGQTIEMQVVGTGDADIWRFEVGDEVTLSLPAGEMRARQLKRLPRKEFDSTVEMWLAPGLQHLPVRLRVTQANGDVADQQLRRMP